MIEEKYPYNLPIWRRSHRQESPNRDMVAEINPAYEVSMSNPTIGTLEISCGITLPNCNPSFIWSDDSRYLAVPHFFYWRFLFRKQRLVIIDVLKRVGYASRKHTWYFQPKSFNNGKLIVTVEPFRSANDIEWLIPQDINTFKPIVLNSSKL